MAQYLTVFASDLTFAKTPEVEDVTWNSRYGGGERQFFVCIFGVNIDICSSHSSEKWATSVSDDFPNVDPNYVYTNKTYDLTRPKTELVGWWGDGLFRFLIKTTV